MKKRIYIAKKNTLTNSVWQISEWILGFALGPLTPVPLIFM
jgi:hypothetical protein